MNDKIMETSFDELYSSLAVAPLYNIQLIFCIGYVIFTRKDKGIFVLIFEIYSIFIIVNYLVALYYHFFH